MAKKYSDPNGVSKKKKENEKKEFGSCLSLRQLLLNLVVSEDLLLNPVGDSTAERVDMVHPQHCHTVEEDKPARNDDCERPFVADGNE